MRQWEKPQEVQVQEFWSKVDKSEGHPKGCWEWQGSRTNKYGQTNKLLPNGERYYLAHRYAYRISQGSIPKGMDVDHRCRNTICARPEHLRLLSRKHNLEYKKGLNKNNTSGHRGVFWMKREGMWRAEVTHNWEVFRHTHYIPPYELHVASYYARVLRNRLFTHNDADREG